MQSGGGRRRRVRKRREVERHEPEVLMTGPSPRMSGINKRRGLRPNFIKSTSDKSTFLFHVDDAYDGNKNNDDYYHPSFGPEVKPQQPQRKPTPLPSSATDTTEPGVGAGFILTLTIGSIALIVVILSATVCRVKKHTKTKTDPTFYIDRRPPRLVRHTKASHQPAIGFLKHQWEEMRKTWALLREMDRRSRTHPHTRPHPPYASRGATLSPSSASTPTRSFSSGSPHHSISSHDEDDDAEGSLSSQESYYNQSTAMHTHQPRSAVGCSPYIQIDPLNGSVEIKSGGVGAPLREDLEAHCMLHGREPFFMGPSDVGLDVNVDDTVGLDKTRGEEEELKSLEHEEENDTNHHCQILPPHVEQPQYQASTHVASLWVVFFVPPLAAVMMFFPSHLITLIRQSQQESCHGPSSSSSSSSLDSGGSKLQQEQKQQTMERKEEEEREAGLPLAVSCSQRQFSFVSLTDNHHNGEDDDEEEKEGCKDENKYPRVGAVAPPWKHDHKHDHGHGHRPHESPDKSLANMHLAQEEEALENSLHPLSSLSNSQ